MSNTLPVYLSSTSPSTVIDDYLKVLANFPKPKNTPTVVKLNLSWTKFYPAVSTPPWAFEAVIKWLTDSGVSPKNIIPVENRTVVTDVHLGAKNHGWDRIAQKYQVKIHYLTEEKYSYYRPKSKMLVLDKIFPKGIFLPTIIQDKPLISLCTLKSHVFTQVTGAVKNYFGMLKTNRHYCHREIHKAIIDLLQIQQELHPSIIGLMDGTVLGYGPGPRAMSWMESNLILASSDEIALDSTAARIIGFTPQDIDFLRLGQELGLGNYQAVPLVGLKTLPNFKVGFKKDTFASRCQKFIYHHLPPRVEHFLLRSFIAPWSYAASNLYHDVYWYRFIGTPRKIKYLTTNWGKLFQSYQTHDSESKSGL